MKQVCKNCSRWVVDSDLKNPSSRQGFNECNIQYESLYGLIEARVVDLHDRTKEEISENQDGYIPLIMTHAYFGCIQFEPKDEK